MRTEDDLRAAFGALEGQVADGTRILTGVARERHRRTLRRRAGGVLAAAALSAAAAVAVAQVPAAPRSPLSAAAVRVKLLAAWGAAGNDILVMHSSSPGGPDHELASTVNSWSYPWAASPGQRAQTRSLLSRYGKKESDYGGSYKVPEPGAKSVSGPGIQVDYSSRTWSHVTLTMLGSPLNPSDLKSQIASGAWKVSGPTDFHGRQALELTETITGHATTGQIVGQTIRLWVDASTYLPLHEYATTFGADATPPITSDFELLPPTAANLALLKPVIPAGFPQLPGANPTAAP